MELPQSCAVCKKKFTLLNSLTCYASRTDSRNLVFIGEIPHIFGRSCKNVMILFRWEILNPQNSFFIPLLSLQSVFICLYTFFPMLQSIHRACKAHYRNNCHDTYSLISQVYYAIYMVTIIAVIINQDLWILSEKHVWCGCSNPL